MTSEELQAIVAGLIPELKTAIDERIKTFEVRMAAVEARPGLKGERGEKGEPGERGPIGEKGERGEVGPIGDKGLQGDPGPQGEMGPFGLPGSTGERGPAGEKGLPGERGEAGVPGAPGAPGSVGQKGETGARGDDGQDGLGFDDIDVAFDGDRTFSLAFVRGDRRKVFGSFSIPSLIDRGVYKDGQTYHKGDCVSWGGSLFIAQGETTGKPEQSPDWRLAVKRGRDGKDGKPAK